MRAVRDAVKPELLPLSIFAAAAVSLALLPYLSDATITYLNVYDVLQRFADYGTPGSDPGPYMWSYTMTSFDTSGGSSRGMTSIRNNSGGGLNGPWYPFKQLVIRANKN